MTGTAIDVVTPAQEAAVLRRLLSLIMAPAPPAWDALPADPLAARMTYYVLQRDAGIDVEGFLTGVLGRLLRHLPCSSERYPVARRERITGRIGWPATLKARYAGDCDPNRYVCYTLRRHYDTPENQLLKYLLASIRQCLDAVPRIMSAGFCLYPAFLYNGPAATATRLAIMDAALRRCAGHERLRDVSLPQAIGPEHLQRAQASKIEDYGLVLTLYRRYADAVLSPSWQAVARLGRRSLALPARLESGGEPWVKLAAAILQSRAE